MLLSCKNTHTIEGYIKGLGNDTLLVKSLIIKDQFLIDDMYSYTYDTIFVKNDRFFYDNKDNKAKIIHISARSPKKRKDGRNYYPSSLEIFLQVLPNDKIKIEGISDKYSFDYIVKGSPISSEYNTKIRKKKLKFMVDDI